MIARPSPTHRFIAWGGPVRKADSAKGRVGGMRLSERRGEHSVWMLEFWEELGGHGRMYC